MKFIVSMISLILLFSLTMPFGSFAHPGGKDELGGHFRNKDCMYILHSPTPLAMSAKNTDELIVLIQQQNSNKCKNSLTADLVDLEGYSFGTPQDTLTSTQSTSSSSPVSAQTSELQLGKRYFATLERCTDGDTAVFIVNSGSSKKSYKTRFLYIDTPESTKQIEPFGKEAAAFTCKFLQSGSITLETDGGNLFDKYDRLLAWVFVDDQLYQEVITKAGLVEDFYDYGDYKYEERIISAMNKAKADYAGIYAALKRYGSKEKKTDKTVTGEGKKSSTNEVTNSVDEDETMKTQDNMVSSNEEHSSIVIWMSGVIFLLTLVGFIIKRL